VPFTLLIIFVLLYLSFGALITFSPHEGSEELVIKVIDSARSDQPPAKTVDGNQMPLGHFGGEMLTEVVVDGGGRG
jgi:hypothetical protein